MNYTQCWWKGLCQDEDCSEKCIQFKEMCVMLRESGLPESKWGIQILQPDKCDLDAFIKLRDIKLNIGNFVNNGNNLLITSKIPGNGKTTWAIKLMQSYFNLVLEGNGYKCRGLFINVPHFFIKLKDNISNRSIEFEEMKSRLEDVDLVVWDDIATATLTKYEFDQLLSIIDSRLFSAKSNIYTSNVNDYNDLARLVGDRLASRVYRPSEVVEFIGRDRRGL